MRISMGFGDEHYNNELGAIADPQWKGILSIARRLSINWQTAPELHPCLSFHAWRAGSSLSHLTNFGPHLDERTALFPQPTCLSCPFWL